MVSYRSIHKFHYFPINQDQCGLLWLSRCPAQATSQGERFWWLGYHLQFQLPVLARIEERWISLQFIQVRLREAASNLGWIRSKKGRWKLWQNWFLDQQSSLRRETQTGNWRRVCCIAWVCQMHGLPNHQCSADNRRRKHFDQHPGY